MTMKLVMGVMLIALYLFAWVLVVMLGLTLRSPRRRNPMPSPINGDSHANRETTIRKAFTAEDDVDGEGARPSSLLPYYHHKPARAYLLQLKYAVEKANEEAVRVYGPLPAGGLPVQKKTKLKAPYRDFQGHVGSPVQPIIEESDEMKLRQIAGSVALSAAIMMGEIATAATAEEGRPAHDITTSATASINLSTNEVRPEDPVDHTRVGAAGKPIEPQYRTSFKQCMDASNGVTVNMMNCIGEEFDYQDKRLNTAYKRLHQVLAPADWERIRNEQRKWLASRDVGCKVSDDMKGGTAEMLILADCGLQKTAIRADELETLLKQQSH